MNATRLLALLTTLGMILLVAGQSLPCGTLLATNLRMLGLVLIAPVTLMSIFDLWEGNWA